MWIANHGQNEGIWCPFCNVLKYYINNAIEKGCLHFALNVYSGISLLSDQCEKQKLTFEPGPPGHDPKTSGDVVVPVVGAVAGVLGFILLIVVVVYAARKWCPRRDPGADYLDAIDVPTSGQTQEQFDNIDYQADSPPPSYKSESSDGYIRPPVEPNHYSEQRF